VNRGEEESKNIPCGLLKVCQFVSGTLLSRIPYKYILQLQADPENNFLIFFSYKLVA
jgi:hypothetical protein